MAKPKEIELPTGLVIPILYEDRVALALDKPQGWMLAPDSWEHTSRNLQLALISAINAGDFWARSRNLRFLRFVHRLDAETTGIVLFAKSPGALQALSELFETRRVEKKYLAVVHGVPKQREWSCHDPIGPDPGMAGRMKINARSGKPAETHFRVLQNRGDLSLIEARPVTGRTHQIRVHLLAGGHPVLGDPMYGPAKGGEEGLMLRAVELHYPDPFQKRTIHIKAPTENFVSTCGFDPRSLV